MRCFQTFVLSVFFTLASLLATCLAQQPPNKPAPPPPAPKPAEAPKPVEAPKPAPPPKADPEAAKLLDQAITDLDPQRVGSVSATFDQQVYVQGIGFQATGKYLTAPGNRLHLTLNVVMGPATGNLEAVSDGTTFQESASIGDSQRRVAQSFDLKQVLDGLKDYKEGAQVGADFLRDRSFRGLEPLLKRIRQRMVVTRQDKVRQNGRELIRLTAAWSSEVEKSIMAATRDQWPAYLARECLVYLGHPASSPKTLWPYRFEWRGPIPPRPENGLLWQLEFSDPKLNQPLSAAEAAREFKIEPAPAREGGPDWTKTWADALRYQAEQLAGQKKGK